MRYLIAVLFTGLLIGCANTPNMHEFNYIDQASSAGFSYERQFEGEVFVCVDGGQAQAYVIEGNTQKWLRVTRTDPLYPVLITEQKGRLTDTQFCLPLKEFNELYGKRL